MGDALQGGAVQNRARIVVGRDGRIALVNKNAEKLLGARAPELLGIPSEALVAERHRRRHIRERDGYFAEPWSLKPDCGFFVTVVNRLGRERVLFAVPEPIASEDGLWVSVTLYPPEESAAFEVYGRPPPRRLGEHESGLVPKAV